MRLRICINILFSLFFVASLARDLEPCPFPIASSSTTETGIYVRDLTTGQEIASVNADSLFIPASITKAITVASTLSQLPPDFTYTTSVTLNGTVNDSTLNGNIVVNASGDPTIASRHFKASTAVPDSIASAVATAGIKKITGDVVFNYPFALEETVPSGWMREDLIQSYGTAYHAVNYHDNVITFNASTGTSSPRMRHLEIIRDNGRKLSIRPGETKLYVGKSAKGSYKIASPDPADAFGTAIITALNDRGISVAAGKVKESNHSTPIFSFKSPRLEEIMRSLMFRSDNMMAEATLRLLAPRHSRRSASQRELSLWEARGIDTRRIFIEDGSGLSRKNRLSPRFMSEVLEWMLKSGDADTYLSFFPKAGREGTMRRMLKGSRLEGRLATKTGSMRGVQCFAGYLLSADGTPTHSIVIMVNAFKCNRASLKKAIGDYLLRLFPE